MITWLNRIYFSDEVGQLLSASDLDSKVLFTYINIKTGRESSHFTSLVKAINLAETRRNDGRYKNFEFYVSCK